MDNLDKLNNRLQQKLLIIIIGENIIMACIFLIMKQYVGLNDLESLGFSLMAGLVLSLLCVRQVAGYIVQPLKALWQVILHINPNVQNISAPDLNQLKLGRELVASLSAQVYQLASLAEKTDIENKLHARDLHNNFIAQNIPLPLLVLDPSQTISFANEAAAKYIGISSSDMIGKNVYMVMDMSFTSSETFDSWLKDVKVNSATAASSWERVRLSVRDNHPTLLFDLAAYYNRDNADKNEVIMVLFDHTKTYSQDDQAISFMALGVHELRSPLTLLRGYIEVFEQELSNSVDAELKSFMLKMHAQAEQLTDYVNNILNVARIDDDQLELRLQSEDWSTILKGCIEIVSLRAKVRNITLKCRIMKDLPPVGVDRLSIEEVISNLVDNAIKYSGDSKVVKIETYLNKEGLVETIVQDFGSGISTSLMPNLFSKFYRDHHNRAQIGGTGLGLYLCKGIINAHGGTIWVRSHEGEGSTFGFTLIPYSLLAENLKHKGNEEITRSAHGWIKNHSLYRR